MISTLAQKTEFVLWIPKSTCFYESQSSTSCNDRKSCCQCCQIGRRQYAEYGSCDPGIALPEPCKSAYLSCCIESVDTSVPVIQAKFSKGSIMRTYHELNFQNFRTVPSKPTTSTTTVTTTRTTTTTTRAIITPRRSLCDQYGKQLCEHICIDMGKNIS